MQGGGGRGRDAEELILRTVAAHAESLLRTARRFSLCPDDAQDAYQRALEIFMGHAERLDPDRAAGWLHVVVKREAQAIRRSRQKLVTSEDIDLDAHEAHSVPTPDERLAAFDLVGRSAEALQRLKPPELRALWLRAQGHSYNEIGAMTGWSYTKVNRCLAEGRRSFLERYADIESGVECTRWLPVISAMVDGEATSQQLVELRPHLRNCPGCRATLRALQDSSAPLAAVMPIPLVAVVTDAGDHVVGFFARAYELLAGGLHDRAAASFTKVQAVVETTATGKAAAIAGAAAAVASGGYATVERSLVERRVETPRAAVHKVAAQRAPVARPQAPLPRSARRTTAQRPTASNEFERPDRTSIPQAPEFSSSSHRLYTRADAGSGGTTSLTSSSTLRSRAASSPAQAAPEFAGAPAASEFGP